MDISQLIDRLYSLYPQYDQKELYERLSTLLNSTKFQLEVIEKVDSPRDSSIALKKYRTKRLGGKRQAIEEKKVDLMENIKKIKKVSETAIELQELAGSTTLEKESSGPSASLAGLRFNDSSITHSTDKKLLINSTLVGFSGLDKYFVDQSLSKAYAQAKENTLLTLSNIVLLNQAIELYKYSRNHLQYIKKILNKDFDNRRKLYGVDLEKELDELDSAIEYKDEKSKLEENNVEKKSKNIKEIEKIQSQINFKFRMIILNEVDNVSSALRKKFLNGVISHDEYSKRLLGVHGDFNEFWHK